MRWNHFLKLYHSFMLSDDGQAQYWSCANKKKYLATVVAVRSEARK